MFHLKLKDTLKHSIATVTSHMDSFVYNSFINLPIVSEIRHTLNIIFPYNRSWIDEKPLSISPLKKTKQLSQKCESCLFFVTVHWSMVFR